MSATSSTAPAPSVSVLLNLVPDRPSSVAQSLEQHPELASQQDQHGYSLVHAAVSYGQLDLLRDLVKKHGVDVNLIDEDGESALFFAEAAGVARCLVEELDANVDLKNAEGQTAQEKIEAEGDYPEVASYLRSRFPSRHNQDAASSAGNSGDVQAPPPLPPNVQINMGTMEELPAPTANGDSGADPEFRRRIDELVSRNDFQSPEGQAQLRELITEAVRGVANESDGRGGARARRD